MPKQIAQNRLPVRANSTPQHHIEGISKPQIIDAHIITDEPQTNRGHSFTHKEASAIAFALGFLIAWGIGLLINSNNITLNTNAVFFSLLACLALGNLFCLWSIGSDFKTQIIYLKFKLFRKNL